MIKKHLIHRFWFVNFLKEAQRPRHLGKLVIASVITVGFPAQALAHERDGSALGQTQPETPLEESQAHRTARPSQQVAPSIWLPNDAPDGQASPEDSTRPEPLTQESPPEPSLASGTNEVEAVVVTAPRIRGSVTHNIPPEQTFSPVEIRAFGVTNVADLIAALGPKVSSNRGPEDASPITLLNGRRVSSFAEVSSIPAEAIERVEVFPEDLALAYGYKVDQKVVNIITFERYSSRIGQVGYSAPTEGGRVSADFVANYFSIRDETRLSASLVYSQSDALLESDRRIRQPLDALDQGQFRTLLPETERLAFSALVSSQILEGISSTFNGRIEASEAWSLLGLNAATPLTRDSEAQTLQIGTTQSGRAGKFSWTLTGNYSRTQTDSFSDTIGFERSRETAKSTNSLANADLLLSGPIMELPAGPVSANLRGGFEARDYKSRSDSADMAGRTEISRNVGVAQGSVTLPIFDLGNKAPGPFGAISINANFDLEKLSDFGTLRTFGYGLVWSPSGAINLIASATREERAPTVEQLGAPLVLTPNTRIYDFARREIVDVTRVFGGNSALLPDERHVTSLGIDVKPFASADFNFGIDYLMTRVDNPIATFPMATPEIEAAFPNRFTRSDDGRLLRVDIRPVNFSRSDKRELRWGLNYTRMLGSTPPLPPGSRSEGSRVYASESEMRRRLPPGVTVVEVLPGSPAARRMETLASRVYISLYHTWRLKDELRIHDDGATIDLLDEGRFDFSGASRHRLELQAGVFKRGLGARLDANWQSGTDIRGFERLASSDLTTVNINLFANLAEQFGGPRAPQWLKGARVNLSIDNLLNSRLKVRNEAGPTPLNYQSAYFDPLGRSVTFALRKIF